MKRAWRPAADGLLVRVRLTPKASRGRVEGPVTLADGTMALKIHVTAPPVDGAANAALIKLLAKTWRLPKSTITIAAGATGRTKVVALAGNADDLAGRLDDWLGAMAGDEN